MHHIWGIRLKLALYGIGIYVPSLNVQQKHSLPDSDFHNTDLKYQYIKVEN